MEHIGRALTAVEKNIILKGADALSTHGFTQVPNHVLKSDKLSPGAKLAYTMLLSYAWQNFSLSDKFLPKNQNPVLDPVKIL